MKRSYPSRAEKRRKKQESRKFDTKLTKVTSFFTVNQQQSTGDIRRHPFRRVRRVEIEMNN
ncbi:hypothetical protein ABVT39_006067, partial [Epinephelus coioides]